MHIFDAIIFFELRTIQQKTVKQTHLCPLGVRKLAEGKGERRNDFATSFLHFSLFSIALWDLANSRPAHSLMLSSHLFFCLPCLLPPFSVPCKTVFARADEQETCPYHCSLHLFTWSGGLGVVQLPAGSWHRLPHYGLCIVCCGSTSFPWLVFFFEALL